MPNLAQGLLACGEQPWPRIRAMLEQDHYAVADIKDIEGEQDVTTIVGPGGECTPTPVGHARCKLSFAHGESLHFIWPIKSPEEVIMVVGSRGEIAQEEANNAS